MLRITDIVRLLKKSGGHQAYELSIAGSAAATAANWTIPLACTITRPKIVIGVHTRYVVASSAGTLNVVRCGAGVAAASGTNVLASTIDISQAADTNYDGVLSTTVDNLIIRPGDALYVVGGGTLTSLSGLSVRIVIQELPFWQMPNV
jgi:hypothetical protein